MPEALDLETPVEALPILRDLALNDIISHHEIRAVLRDTLLLKQVEEEPKAAPGATES